MKNLSFLDFFFFLFELLGIVIPSFLLSLLASIFAFLFTFALVVGGEGGPGEGIGLFIILYALVPTWILSLVGCWLIAKARFSNEANFMNWYATIVLGSATITTIFASIYSLVLFGYIYGLQVTKPNSLYLLL